jgi:hypothetical protein
MKATRAVPLISTGVRHFGTTRSQAALPALLPQDGKKAMRARTWWIQGLTMQEDRANGGIDVVIAPKDLAEMKGDMANWLKFSDAEKDDKINAWRKAGKLKLNPDSGAKYWNINYPKYKEALDIIAPANAEGRALNSGEKMAIWKLECRNDHPKSLHPGWVRFDSLMYGQGVAPGGITEEEIKHDPMGPFLLQLLPIVILLGLAVWPNIKRKIQYGRL